MVGMAVALLPILVGGGGAYYRSQQAAAEKRGEDRARMDVVERDLRDLRANLNALWPLLVNPPVRPAHGDDR